MAASVARWRRFRDGLTIRRRLAIFAVTAIVFALGASYASLSALQEAGAATDRATNISRIQHHHQDAVTQLWSMRSAVLEAVLVSGDGSALPATDPVEEIRRFSDAYDRNIEAIATLMPSVRLSDELPDVRAAQLRYVDDASRLVALTTNDVAAARADLDDFLADAGGLFDDLERTTAILAAESASAAQNARTTERDAERGIMITSSFGTLMIILITALVALSIARQLRQLSTIARSMAAGDLRVRNEINSADELGGLARSFDEMADSFEDLVVRLEQEASQDAFRRELFDAFDMANDEADVHQIVEEAMQSIGDHPIEMLVADSSKHHVTQAATHPVAGPPNCPVGSTGQCVAVRRGHRLVFSSSGAIDACPHLKRRDTACSAVCVPVTFNGEALGVIHATGREGVPADVHTVDRLAALASQTGARLGTIKAFQGARQQATIDGLTGLYNRRSLENEVRAFSATGTGYALIMADLDLFKTLNDQYGHEMGDRALRLFSQVLRDCTREGDIAARLGGEEFVIVQPRMTAPDAVATVERIQLLLATRLETRDDPRFTSSFGLSDTTMAADFDAVLRIADAGLLASKDQGRDRWTIGDPEMASTLSQRGRPRGTSHDLVDARHGPTVLPERI